MVVSVSADFDLEQLCKKEIDSLTGELQDNVPQAQHSTD